MARENPSWGYDRIVGAMANLGYKVSDQAVSNILKRHDIPSSAEAETKHKLERFHPSTHGSDGGNRFLHGRGTHAQGLENVLRAVLPSLGEPANLVWSNNPSAPAKSIDSPCFSLRGCSLYINDKTLDGMRDQMP